MHIYIHIYIYIFHYIYITKYSYIHVYMQLFQCPRLVSLLYIQIFHATNLKSIVGESINLCFNGRDNKFIGITSAIWTNNQQICRLTFDKIYLKLANNLFRDNYYFNLGRMCLSQLIEMRMVSSPVHSLPNLYFDCYGSKWLL